jgi:hypothetical protein
MMDYFLTPFGLQKPSPSKSSDDFFAEDDFNPRSNTAETSADFGDFYSAIDTEATIAKSDDDFADFHSAFSDQTSSLPATMPPPVAPASGNLLFGDFEL